jgi:hypothetical protein
LKGILKPELEAQGFQVVEPDDHIVMLLRGNSLVARFNQTLATREMLNAVAEASLKAVAA